MKSQEVSPLVFKYSKSNPIRAFYHLYDGEKWILFWALVFSAIKASPIWIIPLVTRNIINVIGNPARHSIHELWVNGAIMVILYVQNIPSHTLFIRLFSQINRNMEARLRSALITRLQQLSISFHDDFRSGTLQTKMLRDVESVQLLSDQFVNIIYISLLSIIISVAVTLGTQPMVALFYLVTIPVGVTMLRLFRRRIGVRTKEFRVELENMSARISDMIEMIPVTRAHGVEDVEIERMNDQLERVKKRGVRLDVLTAFFTSNTWVALSLFSLMCLLVTGYMAYHGKIQVGDVVMYLGYFQMILNSVNMILNVYPQLSRGFESMHSIAEILECPDIEQNEGKKPVDFVQGNIVFDKVDFTYNGCDEPAIKGFSIQIQSNECVAFVGESGSGKSTLMNLIIGFRRPSGGCILLDGADMESLDLRTFRRQVAVVSQDTILFSGSIRDNITYGLDDVSEAVLKGAVRAANAEDFISDLPDGLDTMLGEHGGKLSGGQRQRIAIARALVRDPKVIILDEATSALDVSSERLVQEAMDRLIKGRTTLIVAHRLSTIRNAHRIVVMKKARCIEVGTYKELMELKGEFHRLVSMQV